MHSTSATGRCAGASDRSRRQGRSQRGRHKDLHRVLRLLGLRARGGDGKAWSACPLTRGRSTSTRLPPSPAHGLLFIGATNGFVMARFAEPGSCAGHAGCLRSSTRPRPWLEAGSSSVPTTIGCMHSRRRLGSRCGRSRDRAQSPELATVVGKLVFFSTCGSCSTFRNQSRGEADVRARRKLRKPIWTYPDGEYTPVVTDGLRIYLTGYATITALEPSSTGRRKG